LISHRLTHFEKKTFNCNRENLDEGDAVLLGSTVVWTRVITGWSLPTYRQQHKVCLLFTQSHQHTYFCQ